MKNLSILLALVLTTAVGYSQKRKTLKLNQGNDLVEATYYHDNGEISQKGTFDLAGKLHGKWASFDENGDRVAQGRYDKGVRTGKWFFWADDGVKEIEFSDNVIASVIDRESTSGLVTKD